MPPPPDDNFEYNQYALARSICRTLFFNMQDTIEETKDLKKMWAISFGFAWRRFVPLSELTLVLSSFFSIIATMDDLKEEIEFIIDQFKRCALEFFDL